MLAWFKAMGGKPAHACMEATGRHSLGVALALHDAGHVVSVVNPAQIRDFARTKPNFALKIHQLADIAQFPL